MLNTTTTAASAGDRTFVSRKGKGGGAGRAEVEHPNIIEEPLRVIGEKGGRKRGGAQAGTGRASGKSDRRRTAGKAQGKKARG
jgi:hypothetical protein